MKVIPFTEENFAEALTNKYTSEEVIIQKPHLGYFFKYLRNPGIDAHTILIEEEYVSKDFLQDYATYYAFCFNKYPKF